MSLAKTPRPPRKPGERALRHLREMVQTTINAENLNQVRIRFIRSKNSRTGGFDRDSRSLPFAYRFVAIPSVCFAAKVKPAPTPAWRCNPDLNRIFFNHFYNTGFVDNCQYNILNFFQLCIVVQFFVTRAKQIFLGYDERVVRQTEPGEMRPNANWRVCIKCIFCVAPAKTP